MVSPGNDGSNSKLVKCHVIKVKVRSNWRKKEKKVAVAMYGLVSSLVMFNYLVERDHLVGEVPAWITADKTRTEKGLRREKHCGKAVLLSVS